MIDIIGSFLLIESFAWLVLGFVVLHKNVFKPKDVLIIILGFGISIIAAFALLYGFDLSQFLIALYVVIHLIGVLNLSYRIYQRRHRHG